jgi:hypothetical protein
VRPPGYAGGDCWPEVLSFHPCTKLLRTPSNGVFTSARVSFGKLTSRQLYLFVQHCAGKASVNADRQSPAARTGRERKQPSAHPRPLHCLVRPIVYCFIGL